MQLEAHGINARLPAGFEGRIFTRAATGPGVDRPVAHFATFGLAPDVADFGGGAVNLMKTRDIFVVLFEYGPESVSQILFARPGIPRPLTPGHFSPQTLRRGMGGQSGTQWFFNESGRPFCLYVVLGSHALRASLVPRVNDLLNGLMIEPTVGVST